MKKAFISILVAIICLYCVSCANNATTESGSESVRYDQDQTDIKAPISNTDQKNKLDMSKFESVTAHPFSEGKAIVHCWYKTNNVYHTSEYCIDKNGNILFSIENPAIQYTPTGFYNGITSISGVSETPYLCDSSGHIIKPEDIGGTAFLIDTMYVSHHTLEMFKDGYILIERTTTDFAGSTTELAIINADLDLIVDFSTELFELYKEKYKPYCEYYNGYLYRGLTSTDPNDPCVLDLNTGKELSDPMAWAQKIPLEYRLKREVSTGYYFDCFDDNGSPVIDLSKYKDTISDMSNFGNGTANISFISNDKTFFTAINVKGEFLFDPIEVSGALSDIDYDIIHCDEHFLVCSYGDRGNKFVTLFDKTGNIIVQKEISRGDGVKYSDGTILIFDIYGDCQYWNMNFEPLF